MKIVLCFVFLGFALVLSHQDVQKRGGLLSTCKGAGTGANNNALRNLMEDGKPIPNKLSVSHKCKADMAKTKTVIRNRVDNAITGVRFDFPTTCYVTEQSNMVVFVYAGKDETLPVPPGSQQCADVPAFQAVFLNQDPNTNTYMTLQPDRAPWFFTLGLSGCDIFVATSQNPGQRNNPIVIHSNLDNYGNKLENLRTKGAKVDQLLQSHPNYRLIARVYNAPPRAERMQADQYLQQYKANHPGIRVVSYDTHPPATPQIFQFIGHYDRSWTFILKGEVDGRIQAKITP